MTKDDIVNMRNLIIFALAVMIAGMAMIPAEVSDAETYPSELAELQFWNGVNATVIYAYPDKPIGDLSLPSLPGTATYWVRMDTGEVVTSQTVFAPGSYLIYPYSWMPEPWGSSSTSSAPDNTLPVTAIVLSAVAIITSGVAIVMLMRKK